ncbi:MAG TPA: STAS domain-containing protein [Sporichthyaceae bacterium]|jgi:anti-anti-sigma factor|nr:STAS domain-containing protein [Sporichthyaceae bacterium]
MDATVGSSAAGASAGGRIQVNIGPAGEVIPVGTLDIGNARLLHAALADAKADPALVVDLRRVRYLDSAAVTVLFAHAHKPLRILVRAGSAVAQVVEICGLSRVAQVELPAAVDPTQQV